LDLVTELEGQGLSRKIVADMFGLALRSYQQKVDRLTESASEGGVTLWQAVYDHLRGVEVAARAQVLRRFARDDEASVKSILRDLVETGLVYQRGRGESCTYRIAPESDLAQGDHDTEGLSALCWVFVYRDGPIREGELARRLKVTREALRPIVAQLQRDGRIDEEADGAAPSWSTRRCSIPLGDEAGWEAALVDHHQAVVSAVCNKLRNGATRALPPDRIGGSTYSFDVWPGHPYEAQAYALLSETRQRLSALWDRVSTHNQGAERPERGVAKVTFYCGQSVAGDEPSSSAGPV
jgi:chromosome segregation and condensation protein ScpB